MVCGCDGSRGNLCAFALCCIVDVVNGVLDVVYIVFDVVDLVDVVEDAQVCAADLLKAGLQWPTHLASQRRCQNWHSGADSKCHHHACGHEGKKGRREISNLAATLRRAPGILY